MSKLPPDLDSDTDDSDSHWSEEERLLLRSADNDRPSSHALAATLAAVGIGAASSAASSAAAAAGASAASASAVGAGTSAGTSAGAGAAKWGGAIVVSKWIGIVAIGGGIAATGVVLERRASEPTHTLAPAQPARVTRPAARIGTIASEPAAAPEQGPSVSVDAPPETPRAQLPAPRSARVASQKHKETPAPLQPDLSREIAAIDEARSTLRRGSARDALMRLDRYDAEFAKSGRLQLEAAALRIEALFRSGERTRARALADVFLARHPTSPYATRIRALVADVPGVPSGQ